MIGKTLGQYAIEALLGAGGMGEVYRARDTKLGREVAIKVLSPEFAEDAERLSRFQREARLLASLNHPNVATLYGLESSEGQSFLVMELVEGETLAEAIARGPLSIEEALPVFRQIAAGLDAAHDKGVVHRDLKPANIKITPDGDIKILDFGLAKALAVEDDAVDDISASPTLTKGTALGVIMGTAPYMSPEQARGRAVDKRTDIWAFGCCLYEALTGRRPFDGETVTDILAAVVKNEPDWSRLPANLPESTRRVLRRCLDKDRRLRLRDIGDAGLDVDATENLESAVGRSSMTRTVVASLVAALVSGMVVWSWSSSSETPTRSDGAKVTRATVTLTAPLATSENAPLGMARSSVALSRDGAQLVYVAGLDGTTQLYLRAMSELEARPLAGTEGAFDPFFSPDGQWIGFFTEDRLKKVSLLGGEPTTLCEARNPNGASWGPDDFILFSHQEGSSLSRVPAAGGEPELMARPDPSRGEIELIEPFILPGGTHALVSLGTARENPDYYSIVVIALDSGERRFVAEGAAPRYTASGHLIFSRSGALFAAYWDWQQDSILGSAVPVLKDVRIEARGLAQLAFSEDGTLVYADGPSMGATQPVWRERSGAVTPLNLPRQRYGTFELSPDGRALAIVIADAQQDIWIHELTRESSSRLTTEGVNGFPVWTPDGQRVTFVGASKSGGYGGLYWKAVDGSGEAERILGGDFSNTPTSWLPDGTAVALSFWEGGDVMTLSVDAGGVVEPLLQSSAVEWGLTFSPDGRYMAYTSDESGRYDVFVQPYPPTGPKFQISNDGGEEPQWSPRGDELFYRNGNEWMHASITTEPELAIGRPQLLFRGNYLNVPGPSYDVSPDGKRFLLLQPPHQEPPTELRLIVNWFGELERRVPKEQTAK